MAVESSGLWSNLPSIIIVEIFSYLNSKDKINASSVCKAWRYSLFHPKLWRKVVFHLNNCDKKVNHCNEGASFLAKYCGRFAREAVIELNSDNLSNTKQCDEILKVLSLNYNLRALSIKPQSPRLHHFHHSDPCNIYINYASHIIHMIQHVKCLEHLGLGCISKLTDQADSIVKTLAKHQSLNICSLHVSSIKEHPGNYLIQPSHFQSFLNLENLSIDNDFVNDHLVEILSQPNRRPLKRLSINVHQRVTRPTSGYVWRKMAAHSPQMEIIMNLLYIEFGIEQHFNPEVPLTHLRIYFCTCLDAEMMMYFALTYNRTLQSLILVDNVDSASTFSNSSVDPLVILAWRCKKLSHLKIIGYEVAADSLIGIARLRSEQLQHLEVPLCSISFGQIEENNQLGRKAAVRYMKKEVSSSLGRSWEPLSAGGSSLQDSFMEELLKEQTW